MLPSSALSNRIFFFNIYFLVCVSYEKHWHWVQGRQRKCIQNQWCTPVVTWSLTGIFPSIMCSISKSSCERWPLLTYELVLVALWTLLLFEPHCDIHFENSMQLIFYYLVLLNPVNTSIICHSLNRKNCWHMQINI